MYAGGMAPLGSAISSRALLGISTSVCEWCGKAQLRYPLARSTLTLSLLKDVRGHGKTHELPFYGPGATLSQYALVYESGQW